MRQYTNPLHDKLFSSKAPYFGPDVETKIVPVPTGGWDAISPLSSMETQYAVTLINWVPRTGYVEFRGGYNAWCQGLAALPVETLMTYRPQSGTQQFFAAVGTEIWDVGLYGLPSLVVSSLSSARWQYINMMPAGGTNYLYLVNGSEAPKIYNGTTWSTPTITGVTPSNLINICLFKRRIWFVEKNSTSVWYLATDAIQGAATEFPLGSFLTKGGYIIAMGTWTIDGGTGPDDYAVFVTSEGQLVLFKGTNPSDANVFYLVGVFDIPNPIGYRCFVKLGSELGIITEQGLIPISQALPFDPSGVRSVSITNRIQNAMLIAANVGKSLFGWMATTFTQQSLLIMNVPTQENAEQVQFVMNMLTGAWTSFNGWNANCFEIFNGSLYFGDNDGNVNLAYAGATDLSASIVADMKCAFNYFDDPGRNKNMSMLRPLIVADGTIIPTLSVDVDFADSSSAAPVVLLNPTGAVWNFSQWDEAIWSSGAATVNNWLSVTALGTALAVRMQVNLGGTGSTSLGTTSVFDTGVFDTMVFDGNGAIVGSGTELVTLRINAFEALMQFGAAI